MSCQKVPRCETRTGKIEVCGSILGAILIENSQTMDIIYRLKKRLPFLMVLEQFWMRFCTVFGILTVIDTREANK